MKNIYTISMLSEAVLIVTLTGRRYGNDGSTSRPIPFFCNSMVLISTHLYQTAYAQGHCIL